ncbi:DUF4419 domain-containing protein [Pyxidicoccus sp. 3LG]
MLARPELEEPGMTTFEVDSVLMNPLPPPTDSLGELVKDALWMAPGPQTRVVDPGRAHPLLLAVHRAFAEHRPLVLSPDAVWLTIAHGFAQHVRLNAKALRSRLVRHEGRKMLKVVVTSLPEDDAGFKALLTTFREKLREELGPGMPRLLSCDFSTSTDIERMAGDVVLMDVMSPFFDYGMECVCGIPRVTLLGTPEDWRAIRRRIDVIAEFDLEWWTSSLVPIADEFVRASEEQPDIELWKEIYKPKDAYGAERATGWMARLFPYVGRGGRFDTRNPLLEVSHAELMATAKQHSRVADGWYSGPGLALRDAPSGMSSVALHVEDFTRGTRETWTLEGGVLLVEVDEAGALVPRAGLVARRSAISVMEVIERIRAEHAAKPTDGSGTFQGVAELTSFYDHLQEATLFPGQRPWRIRPCAQHDEVRIQLAGRNRTFVQVLVDLPDGSVLALHRGLRERIVRLRADQLAPMEGAELEPWLTRPVLVTRQHADEIPMVGPSLIAVLAQALDSGGSTELPDLGPFTEHLEPEENDPL